MESKRSDDESRLRPTLAARVEHDPLPASGLRQVTNLLSKRGAALHFALKGRQPVVRQQIAKSHARRVAVSIRTVSHASGKANALMRHIHYVRRDGAGADQEAVQLFDAQSDCVEGRAFGDKCSADHHHYRITVNPEDGRELSDLKAFCRQLMKTAETDLETPLEWIAGVHYDTGRPHLHVVVRGQLANGRQLRLARDYVMDGLRGRAQELATQRLGPRAERAAPHEIRRDRYTPLDRLIIGTANNGCLDEKCLPPLTRSDALRRLTYLETRGWVEKAGPGQWRIPHHLRLDLNFARDRARREIAAARILIESSTKASPALLVAVNPKVGDRLVGSYVGCQFIGQFASGAHVVVLRLNDGRLGHLQVPDTKSVLCLDKMPEGAIVEVIGLPRKPRASDRLIASAASSSNGCWSATLHSKVCPGDNQKFVQWIAKRVAALAREGVCERVNNGDFIIPADFAQKALQSDTQRWGPTMTHLRVLDDRDLTDQISASGETWLDRQLAAPGTSQNVSLAPAVHSALSQRSAHLQQLGLLNADGPLSAEALKTLGVRHVTDVFQALGKRGKAVFLAGQGDTVSGKYTSRVHLRGISYAVLESRGAVTLAAWHPGLEAVRSQEIHGVIGATGLEFRSARAIGRGLGLG